MTAASFRPGITTLVQDHPDWIQGRRVGLVSHPAALDAQGRSSAELLKTCPGVRLSVLFGPEHGFFGGALAGESVASRRHPVWRIPAYSLYGSARRPSRAMLKNLDVLVFDLQDLGVRPYTFVSTLRFVLEEAARYGKLVIVADRPIPLPRVVDGPLPLPALESFVAAVPVPMCYGMTPGESAQWIRVALRLDVELRVARMDGYRRDARRQPSWPPWVPPSPGIVSWESAMAYPATVCFEAFPHIDHGRAAGLPFQLFGASWINGTELCACLASCGLPGVRFFSHPYTVAGPLHRPRLVDGVRIVVVDANRFRPIATSVCIVHALQRLYGSGRLWRARAARSDFFDKLYGTDRVRRSLLDNEPPLRIARAWQPEVSAFGRSRRQALLYSSSP